jgi:hypothetical protein
MQDNKMHTLGIRSWVSFRKSPHPPNKHSQPQIQIPLRVMAQNAEIGVRKEDVSKKE